jgi:hypothetical protein
VIFLAFVVLGVIFLLVLGRYVSPRSSRKPVVTWGLDDYGAHILRGLSVFYAAGARNAYRMDRLHEEAKRRPQDEPEGLAVIDGPYLDDPNDPRGKPDGWVPPGEADQDPRP